MSDYDDEEFENEKEENEEIVNNPEEDEEVPDDLRATSWQRAQSASC